MSTERQTEASARTRIAGRILAPVLWPARRMVVEEEAARAVHELRLAENVGARRDGEPHPTTGGRAMVARRADERSLHRFACRARSRAAPDDQAHERNAIISEGDHLRRPRRKERRRGWYAPDDERRPIRPCTQPTDDAAVPPAMVSQEHDDVLDQVQRSPVRLRARHAERPLVGRIAHAQPTYAVARPVQIAGVSVLTGDALRVDRSSRRDARQPGDQ